MCFNLNIVLSLHKANAIVNTVSCIIGPNFHFIIDDYYMYTGELITATCQYEKLIHQSVLNT